MKNKAVLIVDTPENCSECILREMSHCIFTQEMIGDMHRCPLTPLPPSINLKQYVDNTELNLDGMLTYQYAQGWNEFRNDILKGETE